MTAEIDNQRDPAPGVDEGWMFPRIWSVCLVVLLAVTYRLWLPQSEMPLVPLLPGIQSLVTAPALSWILTSLLAVRRTTRMTTRTAQLKVAFTAAPHEHEVRRTATVPTETTVATQALLMVPVGPTTAAAATTVNVRIAPVTTAVAHTDSTALRITIRRIKTAAVATDTVAAATEAAAPRTATKATKQTLS